MNEGPHISIKPETVTQIFGFPLTNSFLTALIVLVLFFFVAVYYKIQMGQKQKSLLFYLIHFVLRSLYNFFQPILGSRLKKVFPYLAALFSYILLLNWFTLLPGIGSVLIKSSEGSNVPLLRGNTTDLNTTFALALLSFTIIQYYGIKVLGFTRYLGKFFNFSGPLSFFIGILEFISELSRIISFSFRLFGNIFAGEIIIAVIAFLVPVLASFPFLLLEIFVGFIQALVFALLTAVFINLAIIPSEAH